MCIMAKGSMENQSVTPGGMPITTGRYLVCDGHRSRDVRAPQAGMWDVRPTPWQGGAGQTTLQRVVMASIHSPTRPLDGPPFFCSSCSGPRVRLRLVKGYVDRSAKKV
eukprot:gene798-biopygen5130